MVPVETPTNWPQNDPVRVATPGLLALHVPVYPADKVIVDDVPITEGPVIGTAAGKAITVSITVTYVLPIV